MRALIAGATGFIGRRLALELRERGAEVVCLARDPGSPEARELEVAGCEVRDGDLTRPDSLRDDFDRVEVVYHLAHLMGDDGDDLVGAETDAARALAGAARAAGVARVIYLGGLGDQEASEHLTARHRTAETLREHGPPLTYFRAAMVVGPQSESYILLKSLVERLPAIVVPEWLSNRTQPIGVDDVVEYLADAPELDATRGREVQIGGPETMTYWEMVEGMAEALGCDPPNRLPTPAGISSESVGRVAGTVTRGIPEVAEHLTAGLATDTIVTDPSGAELFDIEPEPYRLSLARAIEEEAKLAEDEA